jgi:predicted CXXCH cytochrome family protein
MKKWLFVILLFLVALNFSFVSQPVPEEKKCSDCHSSLLANAVIHSPAQEDCGNCHQTTGNAHPDNAVKGFTLTQKMPDLCFSCHSDLIDTSQKALVIHQPFNDQKACGNCHSPHSSSEKKLLLSDQKSLCLGCHNKTIKTADRLIANIKDVLGKSKFIHAPVESDGCSACHNPHASVNSYLLAGSFPTTTYVTATKESFGLCFSCHDAGLFEEKTTTSVSGFRDGDKNLHYLHVNGEKGRNCTFCHDVHGSENEHLIVNNISFGSWEMPMKYKGLENGGSCSPGCHAEKTYKR